MLASHSISWSVSVSPAAHCRGRPQRGMNPHEVVVNKIQGQHVRVVLEAFGEAVGLVGEAAHPHAHGQVLPLHIGRRSTHLLDRGQIDRPLVRALSRDRRGL